MIGGCILVFLHAAVQPDPVDGVEPGQQLVLLQQNKVLEALVV